MDLQRFIDWPQRLHRAIEARSGRPYAWGSNDCALFAADLIEAMTGHDLAKPFRGTYRTERGAKRMLKAHGWRDLEAMADAMLPRRAERVRRGDLVLRKGDFGPFLAIVWQGGVIGPGPEKPLIWPAQDILNTWSVG